jgi:hypothetical protein
VIAVFELLSKKISRGEADDVRHALPLIMIASFRPVRMFRPQVSQLFRL